MDQDYKDYTLLKVISLFNQLLLIKLIFDFTSYYTQIQHSTRTSHFTCWGVEYDFFGNHN